MELDEAIDGALREDSPDWRKFARTALGLKHSLQRLVDWVELRFALAEKRRVHAETPNKICDHDDSFTTVLWFGVSYSFSIPQSLVVKQLWEAWERGGKCAGVPVATNDLLRASESVGSSLPDVFRPGGKVNQAWKRMIVASGRRHYMLSPQISEESSESPVSPPNA